jgi:hypothetical protein
MTAPPDAAVDGGAAETAGGAVEAAGADGVAALEHAAATSAATASAAIRDDCLEFERYDIVTDPPLDAGPGDPPGDLSSIVHRVRRGVL